MSLKDLFELNDRRRELEGYLNDPGFAEFDPMLYHEYVTEYEEIIEILESIKL